MWAGLTSRRVPTAVIGTRFHPLLDALDDELILGLDLVEVTARALSERCRITDEAVVDDAGSVNGFWDDQIDGQSPGIEVQHETWIEPEIVRSDAFACIRMAFGQVEAGFTLFGDADLEHTPLEQFSPVG